MDRHICTLIDGPGVVGVVRVGGNAHCVRQVGGQIFVALKKFFLKSEIN